MKVENMTNQTVTRNFFKATMNIIAENTSHNYSMVVIGGIKEQLDDEFKFSKNIRIKGKWVDVDEKINSIGGKELKKFFTKIINLMGPNYLKVLLAKKLNPRELNYLENLGLRFG